MSTPEYISQNGIAKVSLELLFHYRCSYCDTYLSVGDDPPQLNEIVYCRRCGLQNQVRSIELGPGMSVSDIQRIIELISHEENH